MADIIIALGMIADPFNFVCLICVPDFWRGRGNYVRRHAGSFREYGVGVVAASGLCV